MADSINANAASADGSSRPAAASPQAAGSSSPATAPSSRPAAEASQSAPASQPTGPAAVSPELDAMVCDVLDAFLTALADGEDPGVLLACEDAHANRYQAVFSEDGIEACLEGARHFVEMNEGGIPSDHVGRVDRYAIVYAGAVELEDGFQDAVIASFYQRGMACGYSAYLLYANPGAGDGFMWSDPEPAGEEAPLI